MIAGTIRDAIHLQTLSNKWEQKKKSGNVLSKNERNERANWTQDQRMLNDLKEQMEREKEAGRKNDIANKISSGQKLTPEEEQYLASYDPQSLADYRQTQNERKAYEERLRQCKTKDEVQRLKSTKLGNELSSLKKVINDPYISIADKLKKAQQTLGKVRNIQQAEEEFIKSGEYDKLSTEAEEAKKRAEEFDREKEYENAILEDQGTEETVEQEESEKKTEGSDENKIIGELEDDIKHLIFSQQLEDRVSEEMECEKEKRVGKKINLSV